VIKFALFAILFFTSTHGLTADPFIVELGAFDKQKHGQDPELVALTAAVVLSLDEGMPAQKMGLRIGDRLIGLDGVHVVGEAEWDLARLRRPEPSKEMQVTVLRDGQIIELQSQKVLPIRRLGFDFHEDTQSSQRALENIGFRITERRPFMSSLSPRATLALLRWSAHWDGHDDRTWIPALCTQWEALTSGRWRDAAACGPVLVPDSCPEIQRLAKFYTTIAAYHVNGEQPPDPNWHGESLLYYVINYPYPRLFLPSLGTATHPDASFIQGLEHLRLNLEQVLDANLTQQIEQQNGESNYLFNVRRSILDPISHGGWPYRHEEVVRRNTRPKIIKELRKSVADADALKDLSRYALIQANLVDAADLRRKDPLAEALALVTDLQSTSPLLGYLAIKSLKHNCAFWDINNVRERIRTVLMASPLPAGEQPKSLFLDYLRSHEASLNFLLFPDDIAPLSGQLHLVYGALSRRVTFTDLHQQFAAADVATLPLEQRQELMAQMLDYVRDSCQQADVDAMAKLELPGLLCDALGEIAHWHARTDGDQSWLFSQNNILLRHKDEQAMIERVRASQIPWDNHEAATALVRHLYLTPGTPFATELLAELCEHNQRSDLSKHLRELLTSNYNHFHTLGDLRKFNRQTRSWFLEEQLRVTAAFPSTAPLALTLGDRFQALERKDNDWDSIYLHRAHASLVSAQIDQTVGFICSSFSAHNQDRNAIFFTPSQILNDCRSMRTWILQQLILKNELTTAERQLLIASAHYDLVDDAFASLLGVTRLNLKGAGATPGANDF
jgi:hypothetical protein